MEKVQLKNFRNYSGPFSLVPPAGLDRRPDNAAEQLANAQSGRKEAAGWEMSGDIPHPAKGPCWPLGIPAEEVQNFKPGFDAVMLN